MLTYVESLVGKLFKILPLREADNFGPLNEYLDSLWIELSGACVSFPELQSNADFVSVFNIIGYLSTHCVSVPQCKREVFKAIRLIERARRGLDGDARD